MEKKNRNTPTYVVGYKFTNKEGLDAEVISYRGRKDIDIKFSDGSVVTGTTGSYIAKGLPLHPTHSKPKSGDRFPCSDGDTVEIVLFESTNKVLCRWLSDGSEKYTTMQNLRAGSNRHPSNTVVKVGDRFTTNNHGNCEVVEYIDAKNVKVLFDSGVETTTASAQLRLGTVKPENFYQENRVGHEFITNSGWSGVVVEYRGTSEVIVEWQDGSRIVTSWSDINKGGIKPLFQPSVAGVGYFGEGRFIPKSYSLVEGKQYCDEVVYQYWQRMINRVYNEVELSRPSGQQYRGCSVCEEWHNFQNFAEWAYVQINMGEKDEFGNIYHLDKDIAEFGNSVYRPDVCLFVPNSINCFFSSKDVGNTGFTGVNEIKPKTQNSKVGYVARCDAVGSREYLGYYDTAKEAFSKYKNAKEEASKALADKWGGLLDSRVINSLNVFSVRPEGFSW